MWWRLDSNICLAGEEFKTIGGRLVKEHEENKWMMDQLFDQTGVV